MKIEGIVNPLKISSPNLIEQNKTKDAKECYGMLWYAMRS